MFEIRTFSQWLGVISRLFERDPPIVLVVKVFFFGRMIGVIFICKNVPCTTNVFSSTVFNQSPTEILISQESVMDSFVVPSLCISFSSYWPDNILCFLEVFPYLWPWGLHFLITYSGIDRRSNVFSMKPRLATLSFKRCPHVQWTMPSLQYHRHALHSVLGSVSNSSKSSTLPTSWIIRFDSGLSGL